MASLLVVPVIKIINLRQHPNANLLCLADALGYQVVLPLKEDTNGTIIKSFVKGKLDDKGKRVPFDFTNDTLGKVQIEEIRYSFPYIEGQPTIFFPPDTLIPDIWADKFGVKSLLKSGNRVGRIKLRGEPSFGLVVSIPEGLACVEGDNVADYFGATKYEPPVASCNVDAAPIDEITAKMDKFTDIQNGRIFTNIFTDGEEVIFTEKSHGQNCLVFVINGVEGASSRDIRRKRPYNAETGELIPYENLTTTNFWHPWSDPNVRNLLQEIGKDNDVILYGESCGASIQKLDYGVAKGQPLKFFAFGIKINGKFLDWDDFVATCVKYNVPIVSVLYRGPWSMELAKQHAEGQSTLGSHIREGIVVYPVKERNHPKIGRAIVKIVGNGYDLWKDGKSGSDTKDV